MTSPCPIQPTQPTRQPRRFLITTLLLVALIALLTTTTSAAQPAEPSERATQPSSHNGSLHSSGATTCAAPAISNEHAATWIMRDGLEPVLEIDTQLFPVSEIIDDARELSTGQGTHKAGVWQATYDLAATTDEGDMSVAGSFGLSAQAELDEVPAGPVLEFSTLGAAGYRFEVEVNDPHGATLHYTTGVLHSEQLAGLVISDSYLELVIDRGTSEEQSYPLIGTAPNFMWGNGVDLAIPLTSGSHTIDAVVKLELVGGGETTWWGSGFTHGYVWNEWIVACDNPAPVGNGQQLRAAR